MDYKDIEKAERVLTQLTDTFRAVQYLNDVLATLKPVIGGLAQYDAQLDAKKAELVVVKAQLAEVTTALIEARNETVKYEKLLANIRAQLKDIGLVKG